MTRVLITGARDWPEDQKHVVKAVLMVAHRLYGPSTLVSGACPTGVDRMAEDIAESLGWTVELHPADWDKWGKAAGPKRNQEMVNLGADFCLAFPLPWSRGTVDCARRAKAAGIPVHFHQPYAALYAVVK